MCMKVATDKNVHSQRCTIMRLIRIVRPWHAQQRFLSRTDLGLSRCRKYLVVRVEASAVGLWRSCRRADNSGVMALCVFLTWTWFSSAVMHGAPSQS
jgi:uncharacterized protein YjiS (DUF1127 family)